MFILCAIGLLACPNDARVVIGKPYVIDGDTLAFGEVRVRLVGSDAPEMDTVQGQIARNAMIYFIRGREVTCYRTTKRKTYGRIIARCTLPDGRDLDRLMTNGGWSRIWE